MDLVTESKHLAIEGQVMMLSMNRPHLDNLGLNRWAAELEKHLLLVIAKPINLWDKLRLLGQRLRGHLEEDFQFDDCLVSDALIHSHHKSLNVVLDGELVKLDVPIKIKLQPEALALYKP